MNGQRQEHRVNKPRRRYQYSLAFMFAVTTVLCFVFAIPTFIATTVLLFLAAILALLGFIVLCQYPVAFALERLTHRNSAHEAPLTSPAKDSSQEPPPT